jgi:hypothetical protein
VPRDQRPEHSKRRRTGTSRCLKTAVTAGLSSKPRNEAQEYLELWSLKLNRARWARAGEQAREKIEAIDHAISKLKLSEDETSSHEPAGPRVSRTIDFGLRGSTG